MLVAPCLFFLKKLKRLKGQLKCWNKQVLGDVNKQVDKAVQDVDLSQQQIDLEGLSYKLFEQEEVAQLALEKALHFQEEFWQ